jgi:hypothetical protein
MRESSFFFKKAEQGENSVKWAEPHEPTCYWAIDVQIVGLSIGFCERLILAFWVACHHVRRQREIHSLLPYVRLHRCTHTPPRAHGTRDDLAQADRLARPFLFGLISLTCECR